MSGKYGPQTNKEKIFSITQKLDETYIGLTDTDEEEIKDLKSPGNK